MQQVSLPFLSHVSLFSSLSLVYIAVVSWKGTDCRRTAFCLAFRNQCQGTLESTVVRTTLLWCEALADTEHGNEGGRELTCPGLGRWFVSGTRERRGERVSFVPNAAYAVFSCRHAQTCINSYAQSLSTRAPTHRITRSQSAPSLTTPASAAAAGAVTSAAPSTSQAPLTVQEFFELVNDLAAKVCSHYFGLRYNYSLSSRSFFFIFFRLSVMPVNNSIIVLAIVDSWWRETLFTLRICVCTFRSS